MTATTEARNTKRRNAERVTHVVNAGSTIYAGTLVTLLTATGLAVPAGTASAGVVVGVAQSTVIGDGVQTVEVERGFAYQFANSTGAELITKADIGNTCWLMDNQTVSKTDGVGLRKAAGKIIDVDAGGVWVLVG
ncbi:MAG TPA: hypothetical protein VEY92_06285 [Pseudoxanthomonas sp.]|nr:hypothetical protein [Pseudoxanthomonas sp.]